MAERANVLIGTPSYDQKVTLSYLKSVFDLQAHFANSGNVARFSLCTNSLPFIDVARNIIATMVLDDDQYTHLLFIDADQGFHFGLVEDMIALKKDVVGTVYPARSINYQSIWSAARQIENWQTLQSISASYVQPAFAKDNQGNIPLDRGFAQVHKTGTGIILIARSVFDRMATLPGMLKTGYRPLMDAGHSGRLLQCFNLLEDEDGFPLGEDLSFCHRWTHDCDGEIWASVAHEVQHVGQHTFRGRFMDRVEHQKRT